MIKSFLIPKFVYICALPTPNEVLKQLNQLLFKFLWKGIDKVRRVSVINEYGEGGLKMIDHGRNVYLMKIMERGRGT